MIAWLMHLSRPYVILGMNLTQRFYFVVSAYSLLAVWVTHQDYDRGNQVDGLMCNCAFTDDVIAVSCGAGASYSLEQDKCVPCSEGQYQDEEAQFLCKPCPYGTRSVIPGASNVEQCLGKFN